MPPRSAIVSTALALCLAGAIPLPAFAQHATPAARTSGVSKATSLHPPTAAAPEAAPVPTNPLLPAQIPLQAFFPDLSTLDKQPASAPVGFAPLYKPEEWQTYRNQYGAEADSNNKQKSSGQLAFAQKLIDAAAAPVAGKAPATPSGLHRLLLLRAAAIAYRTREGFTTADKAVAAFLAGMDKTSPAQVGALWTLANAMARTSVTPKPERIRYDGIAAKANMQLALLLLDADQVDAAQAIIKQIGYHEGWIKSDKSADGDATRGRIAQVRARVTQVAKMMDYLATQYGPAIHNDPNALMVVYLYGRFVKNDPSIVADLPGRVPNSPFAILAASIDAAVHNPAAGFAAAENLRVAATILPDGLIKQRTLYASLQNYREFLNAPQTERDRIHRTLARMSVEAVIADGAHGPTLIDPFAAPVPPATVPSLDTEPATMGMADAR